MGIFMNIINKLTIVLLIILLPGMTAMAESLPSSFDLRDVDGRSYIGPVRNQGNCGSCYSFGAVVAAETSWNRKYDLYDDKAIDFSEAFIVWSRPGSHEQDWIQ
jgi:C1A family cysteine protease